MKRLLQILIPLALLFSACSKEKSLESTNPDPNNGGPGTGGPGGGGGGGTTTYFLKCKIGGVAKTFNVEVSALKETQQGLNLTAIGGFATDDPQDAESLTLIVGSAAAIKAGTYKVDDLTGTNTVAITYTPSGVGLPLMTATGFLFGGTPFKITVTAVSSTEIAGTFSGTLYEIDPNNQTPVPNPPQKAVSEGEFKVKFE